MALGPAVSPPVSGSLRWVGSAVFVGSRCGGPLISPQVLGLVIGGVANNKECDWCMFVRLRAHMHVSVGE